jgi:hypothetical protein
VVAPTITSDVEGESSTELTAAAGGWPPFESGVVGESLLQAATRAMVSDAATAAKPKRCMG